MAERVIIRRRDDCPVSFKSNSIQYVETGEKDEPQLYRPNSKCKKLNKCEHKHHHKHHHHHHGHEVPPIPPIPPTPPVPPQITYKCDGNGNCNSVTDGTGYATLEECQFNCRGLS